MQFSPALPPSYGGDALRASRRIPRLVALSSLAASLAAAMLLYYLYTLKGDRELLAAAVIFLVIGVFDVFILTAVLAQAYNAAERLALRVVSAVSPKSYGAALDASGGIVLSMQVEQGILAVRVSNREVDAVLVESPRHVRTLRWPLVPVALVRHQYKPRVALVFTRCSFKSGSSEGKVRLPSPFRRELWEVEGRVRYAFKHRPFEVGDRDLDEVLRAVGF